MTAVLVPGEHPTLPRLWLALRPGIPAVTGRSPRPGQMPSARVMFSPLPVLVTSDPARLEELGRELINLAADLVDAQEAFGDPSGQLPLERTQT